MDHHQPNMEAPVDAAERNPDVLRAEMSVLATPQSADYSYQAYSAIQNVQTQCAADVKSVCSAEAIAQELRLVDDAVMSRRLAEQTSGHGLKLIRSIQSLYQKDSTSVSVKPSTAIKRGAHQRGTSVSVRATGKRALAEEDGKDAIRAARKEAKQAVAAVTPNAIAAAVKGGGAGNSALNGAPAISLTANDGRKIPSGGLSGKHTLSPGPIIRDAGPDGRTAEAGGRGGGRLGQFNHGGRGAGGRGGRGGGGGGGDRSPAGIMAAGEAATAALDATGITGALSGGRKPVSPAPVPPTTGAPTGGNGLTLEHGRVNPQSPAGQNGEPAGVGRAGRVPINGHMHGGRGGGGRGGEDTTLRYGGHNAHEAGKAAGKQMPPALMPPSAPAGPAAPVAPPAHHDHAEGGGGFFGALRSFFVPAAKHPPAPVPPTPAAPTMGQEAAMPKPKPVPAPAAPQTSTPVKIEAAAPPAAATTAPVASGAIAPAVVPAGGAQKTTTATAVAASSPAGVIDANAVPVVPVVAAAAAPRPAMGMPGHDHAKMLRDQAAAVSATADKPTPVVTATANGPVFVAGAGASPVNPRAHHVLNPTAVAAPNGAAAGTTPGAVAVADADMAIRPANEQGGIRLRGGHKRPNGGGATVQQHRRAFGDHHWGHDSDSGSESEGEGGRKHRPPAGPRKGCDPRPKGPPRHLAAAGPRGHHAAGLLSHEHHEHPRGGWEHQPDEWDSDSDSEPCDPHTPPVDGPPVDPLYSGALGFGAEGDMCVYQHFDALSQPCTQAIADLYAVRADYSEETAPHHHVGFAVLILGALAFFGVRRCLRRGHGKKVRAFMNAVRANDNLRAVVEAETGLTVPEPPKRCCCGGVHGDGRCRKWKCCIVGALVGLVCMHFALHIGGHIVQRLDDMATREGGEHVSPVFAVLVVLTVLAAELATVWGIHRAVRLVRQRWSGDRQQPTVEPSVPIAAHDGYSALRGDEQGTEMTSRGASAAVYAPVNVRLV